MLLFINLIKFIIIPICRAFEQVFNILDKSLKISKRIFFSVMSDNMPKSSTIVGGLIIGTI